MSLFPSSCRDTAAAHHALIGTPSEQNGNGVIHLELWESSVKAGGTGCIPAHLPPVSAPDGHQNKQGFLFFPPFVPVSVDRGQKIFAALLLQFDRPDLNLK